MIGFKKIKVSEEFIPPYSEIPNWEGKETVSSSYKNSRFGILFFMPNAQKELNEHIHWGESRRDNLVEQGGVMIGNVYRDSNTKVLFAIVSHVIPMHGAVGTPGFLDMGIDASYDVQLKQQELIKKSNGVNRRVGWYHTHPGTLNVFMSSTDMVTQIRNYSLDWQFAVVLNPQKMIWRGFRGANATEVDCIMVCDQEDTVSSRFLKVTKYNYGFRHTVIPYLHGEEQLTEEKNNVNLPKDETQKEEPQKEGLQKEEIQEIVTINADISNNNEDNARTPLLSPVIRNGSLCFDDYILPIEAFVDCLYKSLQPNVVKEMNQSFVMDICFEMIFEPETWCIESIRCLRQIMNYSMEEQVNNDLSEVLEKTDTENTMYAMVHFGRCITDEEAKTIISIYKFDDKHELFLIFSEEEDGIVKYYVSDRNYNYFFNEFV